MMKPGLDKNRQNELINIMDYEEMVFVKNGSFMMGSNDEEAYENEKPQHEVTFSYDFFIGKYLITQEVWQKVMGNNPSYFKGNNLPVERVTWLDSIKFCNKKNIDEGFLPTYDEITGSLIDPTGKIATDITKIKGYRLPTEAEWEYAAKGGNKSNRDIAKLTKYSGSNNLDDVGWYSENSGEKVFKGLFLKKETIVNRRTHPIGNKKPNELNIYDMNGNVWERCTDSFRTYDTNFVTNPFNYQQASRRVSRGGCWFNNSRIVRNSYRNDCTPNYISVGLGFRIVKVV